MASNIPKTDILYTIVLLDVFRSNRSNVYATL